MEFETVERCGRTYVVRNGVESAGFIERDRGGNWGRWDFVLVAAGSEEEGLATIATAMGNWYTAAQAAQHLVKLGAFNLAPLTPSVCTWARLGLLPGAVKILGPGGAGRGGSWRIPGKALAEFVEKRRKGQ